MVVLYWDQQFLVVLVGIFRVLLGRKPISVGLVGPFLQYVSPRSLPRTTWWEEAKHPRSQNGWKSSLLV